MQAHTDDQLMTAVKNGHSHESGYLFERYQKPLYNYFLRLTGSHDVAEDLLQDTFYRVLQHAHQYREGSNFRAWVYTIARNLYRDHMGKNKGTMNIDEFAGALAVSDRSDENLLLREEQKLIRKALNRLQEKKKQVLILSRYQDLKYEEIGKILNLNETAVKVTVFRALKELKFNYLKLAGEAS